MRAGKMRQLIDHYTPTFGTDAAGATTLTYTEDEASIPAEVRNVTRRKNDDGDIQPMGAESWEIRARFMSFAKSPAYKDRIKYGGKFYEITGVEDVRELGAEVILTVEIVEVA